MNELELELKELCKSVLENSKIIFIDTKELVFEENVKMNCFYCGKYNSNWRCPPKIPQIDYKKMFSEFNCGAFVVTEWNIDGCNIDDQIRSESSVKLHKLLLELEKKLYNLNKSNALSFIGGSCKLCKNGCGKERCNNPYQSRSPIEATGINVIKSIKKYGVDVVFPPKECLLRIGLIVWQGDE